jgi:SAM-dependent methyltransferase
VLPLARTLADAGPGRTALAPAQLLARWLSTAAEDDLQPRLLRLADGRLFPLPVARWSGPVTAADESMLGRARGPVLDVGCGPGRLTAALHRRGVEVLGLELLPEVPVLARRAGAPLLLGDVFAPVPRTGAWRTVLLADGNVGIGGDAVRMLRRVRALLAGDGRLLCELHPEAEAGPAGPVRLEGLGVASSWFPWALLGGAALPAAAGSAGLAVEDTWEHSGRAFAALVPV